MIAGRWFFHARSTVKERGATDMASSATWHAVRYAGRRPALPALLAVALAGGTAALAAFLLTLHGDSGNTPGVHASLVAWITLSYVLCGLLAWSRTPASLFGPLMIAAGFTPFLSRLSEWDAGFPQAVGTSLALLPVAMFLHVFLAYPSGRLQSRLDRLVVACGYAVSAGLGTLVVALGTPGTAQTGQRLAVGAVALAGLGILIARRRSTGHPVRRSRDVQIQAFVLALALIFLGLSIRAFGGPVEAVRWVAFGLIGSAPVFFVTALLRARLARSAAADLFVELRADPAPAALRDSLSRALGDPSLQLVYWLAEFGTYANIDGTAAELPAPGDGRSVTVVEPGGVRMAALVHSAALEDEPELLQAVTAAAGMALENAHLHVRLRAQLEELRGSRARILEASQTERKRLERNLHDGAQQRLIALSLELNHLEDRLRDDPESALRLVHARREIAASLHELREIASGIHPAVVCGHGLAVALEDLAARAPLRVELTVEIEGRLPEPVEVAAFYLVSESLANVARYAQATFASVSISRVGAELVVEVVDDGIGGADSERGSGLRGLADRVEALGGRLRVWSPTGGGTRVQAEIPCAP
jgi:signal transduction histidine kinase